MINMKLEVFYDYTCPFCLRGHEYLIEALKQYPQVEVEWRPCEAHPRPEKYGPHSDLCARGMYYAKEHGADIMKYHRTLYDAIHPNRPNIEDLGVVATCLEGVVDTDDFEKKLSEGLYEQELADNNKAVWEEHGFFAVPSLVYGDEKLGSAEGIGLTTQMILDFLGKVV